MCDSKPFEIHINKLSISSSNTEVASTQGCSGISVWKAAATADLQAATTQNG